MIFSKEWFLKHQKILIWFANTWFGKKILCIDGDKSSIGKRKIEGILPNAIFWKKGRKYQVEFRTHDKFGKRLYYAFKPLWYLLHYWDSATVPLNPVFDLGFATLTVYPAAGSNSPVDGYTRRTRTAGVDAETFAVIRAGAGTSASDNDANQWAGIITASSSGGDTDKYVILQRSIFCFDTSALTAGATGVTGVISFYGDSKLDTMGSPALHVSGATPAATNTLAASDFGQLQATSFGNVAYASYSTTGYNDIDMNASGDSNISLTGISKFGTQLSWDILNDSTGLTWVNNENSGLHAIFADTAGTSTDPKLVVTYTPAPLVGGAGFFALL
uniref:Uncharacterized protein n=1 Tax=viral metagenome TaxID=1070528 RepID=A0A6M3KUG8_9ZZZZ